MNKVKLYNKLTIIVSILVPIVVALLLFTKWTEDKIIFDLRAPNLEPIILFENLPTASPLKFLPPIYATINAITAILLVVAVYYIKNGNRRVHENLIKIGSSISCSGICLTVCSFKNNLLKFEVSDETASKTNFKRIIVLYMYDGFISLIDT